MAVYYCPICNEKFYIDHVEEAGETIPCHKCGSLIQTARLAEYAQKTQSDAPEDADELLVLQKKQLEALESIRSMLKFFTTLAVIGIVFSVITAMFMMY